MKHFEDYYLRQAGSGLSVYTGHRFQQGSGLGNILGGLARMVIPVLKRTGKSLLREGLRTGVDVLGDVVDGSDIKDSLKKRVRSSGSRVLRKTAKSLKPAPPGTPAKTIKRRAVAASSHLKPGVKRRKVKHRQDIFG